MKDLIYISALLFMPFYSYIFLRSLFLVITFMKEENEYKRDQAIVTTCIFFALIMWTFSSLIVLIVRW